MRTITRTSRLAALAALTLPLVAGAHAGAAAAPPAEPVTLRMGTPYDDPALQAGTGSRYTPAVYEFISELDRLSDGAIDVEIVWQDDDGTEFSGQPDGEQRVVQSVIDGDVELAWAGTRVFDTFDVNSLQALHAPFLVDSYALQDAILAGDLSAEMLAGLEPIGLEGLAVLAGGLRKPIGREAPLLNPDDFAGITFQLYRSDVQAAAIEALGATVTDVVAGGRDAGLAAGEIDGHEHSLRTYVARGNPGFASYVTANVNLWPETVALIASPDALAALSAEQQEWVRAAAATASAGSAALYDEELDLLTFACALGATVAEATDDDLAALRAAVEPVYDELRTDAQTATLIDRIVELKSTITAEPLGIPAECGGAAPERVADGSDDPSALNGSYQLEWTVDELIEAGVPADVIDEFRLAGVWIWTFQDGEVNYDNEVVAGDACSSTYELSGDVIDIHPAPPTCPFHFTATWELTDDALVLSDLLLNGVPEPVVDIWLGSKPLTRID